MKQLLPPHIAWPLFVIALLLFSMATSLFVVFAAHSDGGAQVIDNYYEKAVNWDATMARRTRSEALGWKADLEILPPQNGQALHILELRLRDRDGQPVTRLTGTVSLFRPQRTSPVLERPLKELPDRPGVYQHPVPLGEAGLWDVLIRGMRDGDAFEERIRFEHYE